MSDIKCPFCGEKLKPYYGYGIELYSCSNLTCKGTYMEAEDDVWQELIRTRKALDIAVDLLKEINDGEIPVSLGICMDINDALEQITALTKGGGNE